MSTMLPWPELLRRHHFVDLCQWGVNYYFERAVTTDWVALVHLWGPGRLERWRSGYSVVPRYWRDQMARSVDHVREAFLDDLPWQTSPAVHAYHPPTLIRRVLDTHFARRFRVDWHDLDVVGWQVHAGPALRPKLRVGIVSRLRTKQACAADGDYASACAMHWLGADHPDALALADQVHAGTTPFAILYDRLVELDIRNRTMARLHHAHATALSPHAPHPPRPPAARAGPVPAPGPGLTSVCHGTTLA